MSAFPCPHCGGEIVIAPTPRSDSRWARRRDAEDITERRRRYLVGLLNREKRRLVP